MEHTESHTMDEMLDILDHEDEEDEEEEEDEVSLKQRVKAVLVGMGAGFGLAIGMAVLNNSLSSAGFVASTNASLQADHSLQQQQQHQKQRQLSFTNPKHDFYKFARKTGTDKVTGVDAFPKCLADPTKCHFQGNAKPKCNVLHMYHKLYNKWLEPYAEPDAAPFQFLEIGFHQGHGFDAFQAYMPRGEMYTIELDCRDKPDGGWAGRNKNYQKYRDENILHCGDASDYNFLQDLWQNKMKRPNAPPLKVVVDDASHMAPHMVASVFFWFPKIEPGGLMIVEDIQPIRIANKFRTDFLPQIMKDLHYCGDKSPKAMKDKACFPTLWPLLHSIHCEMHICVFERNQEPAVELSQDLSTPPPHALNGEECLLHST